MDANHELAKQLWNHFVHLQNNGGILEKHSFNDILKIVEKVYQKNLIVTMMQKDEKDEIYELPTFDNEEDARDYLFYKFSEEKRQAQQIVSAADRKLQELKKIYNEKQH